MKVININDSIAHLVTHQHITVAFRKYYMRPTKELDANGKPVMERVEYYAPFRQMVRQTSKPYPDKGKQQADRYRKRFATE